MSLYVVYVQRTGHVAGAVNPVGVTLPADAAPGALVGAELPLRVSTAPGEIVSVPLPAGELAVHTPDDEPRVFANPLAFGIEPGADGKPKPALIQLPPWDDPELNLTKDSLIITVPTPVDRDTPVLALVAVGAEVQLRPGTIMAGEDAVVIELPVDVPAGSHGVLALVASRTGVLTAVTRQ